MTDNIVIRIILILFLDSYSLLYMIPQALYIIGAALILRKSGLKWFYALIPWFREYQIARCAKREPEGRIYCILCFFGTMMSVFAAIFDEIDNYDENVTIITFIFVTVDWSILIAQLIFNLNINFGLCRIYNVHKIWAITGISNYTHFIPFLVWGISKKLQPQWKVEDIKNEMAIVAKYGTAKVMSEGLTVNLNARTARDFFKKKYLLRDIHLSIPTGHMVLLLGGSGAGKTTFVNAINGFEKADAEIMLDGRNVYKEYNKMKYNVGFVPQQQMMRDKDNVRKTMLDAAELRLPKDVSNPDKIKRVNEVMDMFGLIPVEHNLVGKLSGGQKKRLSISVELLSNPSLFILDEPDSGLDGVMARELFGKLREVANQGKIVIVITHSPDRVIQFFDDVIVLAKDSNRTGRLAFYGSVDEARAFFGKDSMEEIVKSVNQIEEGGDGMADEYILQFSKVSSNG